MIVLEKLHVKFITPGSTYFFFNILILRIKSLKFAW